MRSMNKILYIFSFLFLLYACGTSSKVVKDQEQSTVSAKDYPYIEKFYKAQRLKINGRLDEAAALLNQCL